MMSSDTPLTREVAEVKQNLTMAAVLALGFQRPSGKLIVMAPLESRPYIKSYYIYRYIFI